MSKFLRQTCDHLTDTTPYYAPDHFFSSVGEFPVGQSAVEDHQPHTQSIPQNTTMRHPANQDSTLSGPELKSIEIAEKTALRVQNQPNLIVFLVVDTCSHERQTIFSQAYK